MKKTLFSLVLLTALGLLAYSGSFNVPFRFDGLRQIAENPVIKNLDNFEPVLTGHAVRVPSGSEYNNRRLIGYLSLALNYHFGGLDVTGYHIVNLAIHIMNGILVYLLIMLTFRTPYFNRQRAEGIAHGVRDAEQYTAPGMKTEKDLNTGRGPGKGPDRNLSGHYAPFAMPYAASDPRSLIALLGAVLFVVHPIQTQAVTYIVQRFTSLAAMFYLLSIVLYVKSRLESNGAKSIAHRAGGKRPVQKRHVVLSVLYALCSLLSAIFAMLTKEISFTLPIVIVLYESLFFKSSLKKKLLLLLPLLLTLVIIPLSVMGTHKPLGEILSDLSERTRVQTNVPRWDYLMTQMRVITTYIRLLFLPVNQNLDYDYPIYHSLFQTPVILSSLFLVSLLTTGVYLLRKSKKHSAEGIAHRVTAKDPSMAQGETVREPIMTLGSESMGQVKQVSDRYALCPLPSAFYYRLISFGIFWFFITLSVESSLIPIADVIFEHRVYLPSVGAFISSSAAVYVIVRRLLVRRRIGKAAISALSVMVIALLAGATYARNNVWRDPLGLWQDVLRKSPGNARAYNDLGYLYLMRGQTDKSIEYFRSALKIKPYYSNAHTNLGVAYYNKGWIDAAIEQFQDALALEPYGPDVAEDRQNLGIAFARKGMPDKAIPEFLAALKLTPRDAGIYNDLGVAYRQKGLMQEAIGSFRKAIELEPDYAGAHYNLGLALDSVGLKDEAERHLQKAHHLNPTSF